MNTLMNLGDAPGSMRATRNPNDNDGDNWSSQLSVPQGKYRQILLLPWTKLRHCSDRNKNMSDAWVMDCLSPDTCISHRK